MYDVVLVASTLAYAALLVAWLTRPFASFMHPATLYLVLHFYLFVVRPIAARIYDFDFIYRLFGFDPSVSDKITVIVGANIGLYAFVLATWSIANRPPTPHEAGETEDLRQRVARPLLLVIGVLGPLAVWSALSNWGRRAAAFDSMARSLSSGVQINLEGTGWFTDAALMLAPIAVLTVWATRFRWFGWPVFIAFCVLQAGSGTRGPLVYAIVALITLWLIERRRLWPDARTLAVLGLSVLAFSAIVFDRGNAVREAFGGPSGNHFTAAQELGPLEHMDFANMEFFEFLVFAVPQRTGSYDYFAQNLQIFTEPVPRVLWREKPVGAPVRFYDLWDYGRPIGITGSMPGQGWVSLGYPGIVIQCGLFGLMFALFYRQLLMRRHGAGARLIYVFLFANLVLCVRDGTLLTFVRTLPFYLGPVVLALLGARLFALVPQPMRNPGAIDYATPQERRRALAQGLPLQKP